MRAIREVEVAVVGGAGFLGSHLVEHLVEDRGCSVTVYDNLCVGRKEFVHKKASFVHCDITKSESFLARMFTRRRTKFVFNYAAWPYIPDSFVRPLHVFDVNATGAMYVINAAQESGAVGILQMSSAEIYGDEAKRAKLSEDARIIPHSTYGVAKAAVDNYVQVRWREAKTPCIALRQFNCVGERETHPYVVPEVISQCNGYVAGSPLVIRLGNNSFRDFLYAGDAVRMAVELLERGRFGEVYNMGSEGGILVYTLAKLIASLMGVHDVDVITDPSRIRPWEIWRLQSDNAKLYSVVKARPTVGLHQALERTIAWYRVNDSRWPWE